MALPDLGIAPPDVREAATEFRRMLGSISGSAAGSRRSARWSHGGQSRPAARRHRAADGTPPERRETLCPAAVFVAGEIQEVPVLERSPVFGVVEDVDGPSRASTIATHTLSTSSANPSEAW